jgi:hypothetical protein
MDNIFSGLIVACPNNGGLLYIHDRQIIQLDGMDTTGISHDYDYLLRGVQPEEVFISGGVSNTINYVKITLPDVHDVLIENGACYAVGTQRNEIVKFDCDGNILQRFTFPGEDDSWHINCLTQFKGRLLFSAFGDFRTHQAYKETPVASGFVQDLHTGERVVNKLSQPHSLTDFGTNLLLANSYENELHEYDSAFQLVRKKQLGGYTRGILIDSDIVYVGLSASRNKVGGVDCATILALDRKSLDEMGRLSLPVNEIYTILRPSSIDLAKILATNSSLATRILSCRLEKQEIELNQATAQLNDTRSKLQHESAELQTKRLIADDLAAQLDRLNVEAKERHAQLESELHTKSLLADDLATQLDRLNVETKQRQTQLESELHVKRLLAEDLAVQLDRIKVETKQRQAQLESELHTKSLLAEDLVVQLDRQNAEAKRRELQALAEFDEKNRLFQVIEIHKNELTDKLNKLEVEYDQLAEQLLILRKSRSWRITAPMRSLSVSIKSVVAITLRTFSAVKYLVNEKKAKKKYAAIAKQLGLRGTLSHALKFLSRGGPSVEVRQPSINPIFNLRPANSKPIVVLTTLHCLYVAELIVFALKRAGIDARIINETPAGAYDDVPHFVICPQMFDRLPGLYVAVQMEQSVSTRWFTTDYLNKLENSYAIFDYSLENIAKLTSMGLHTKQFFYLPIGHLPNINSSAARVPKCYDVVFYGDINNDRRRSCLAELQKVCTVKVVNNLFGSEMRDMLRRTKIVVNIHFYANALLETTRLYECLSLGCIVVSEKSSDMHRHEDLMQLVDFVEENDFVGMAVKVKRWLDDESAIESSAAEIATRLSREHNRFDYFFYRFLLASENISFDDFWRLIGSTYPLSSDKLCLNLPEYIDRSSSFDADNHYGFHKFPGLRHSKGWIGCALSYKYMIRLAMKNSMPSVCICEDDVQFPEDFNNIWPKITSYLTSNRDKWDIFSGLIADMHADTKVLGVETYAEFTFVTMNKLVSMVFNVYNQSCFKYFASWDETNDDVSTNTIDRHLEREASITVLTTCPFLVGHKEDLYSTLWGGLNTIYTDLIGNSQSLLKSKIDSWHKKQGNGLLRLTMKRLDKSASENSRN